MWPGIQPANPRSSSKDEKLKLWETLKAYAAPGRTFIAGTGYESARETIKLSNTAADMGFDAALVLTPHYYRSQMQRPECQIAYYHAVADASKIPVIIYNFPGVAGIDVPVETILKIAAHPNIAGIKESSGDLVKVKALVEAAPPHFQVAVGAGPKYFASLQLGARGGILAVGDILPGALVELHRLFRAGDVAAAGAVQDAIAEAAGIPPNFSIPGIKYAMELKGFVGGPVRLPLVPLADADKLRIQAILAAIESHSATVA